MEINYKHPAFAKVASGEKTGPRRSDLVGKSDDRPGRVVEGKLSEMNLP